MTKIIALHFNVEDIILPLLFKFQEYFAQKLDALKNRSKMTSQMVEEKDCLDNDDDSPQRSGFGFKPTVCSGTDLSLYEDTTEVPECKKKKKKHTIEDSRENLKSGERDDDEVTEMGSTEVNQALTENNAEVPSKKKKKKRKEREHEEVRNDMDVVEEVADKIDHSIKKRKKKRRNKDCGEESSLIEEYLLDDGNVSTSRKKNMEGVMTAVEVGPVECEVIATDEDSPVLIEASKKKKKKKRENNENGEFSPLMMGVEKDNIESDRKASDDDSSVLKKKNKKRKKDKDRESHIVDGQSTKHNKVIEVDCTGKGHDVESKKSKTKKKKNAVN